MVDQLLKPCQSPTNQNLEAYQRQNRGQDQRTTPYPNPRFQSLDQLKDQSLVQTCPSQLILTRKRSKKELN